MKQKIASKYEMNSIQFLLNNKNIETELRKVLKRENNIRDLKS